MNPDEREWQAQEAATDCVRSGGCLHELDSTSASYVALVRTLHEPIDVQLPLDFAQRVAKLATARESAVEIESRFEQRLLWMLSVILGVAAIAVSVIYGGSWFGASVSFASQLVKPSLLLTLLGCIGISVLSQQLLRIFAESARSHS